MKFNSVSIRIFRIFLSLSSIHVIVWLNFIARLGFSYSKRTRRLQHILFLSSNQQRHSPGQITCLRLLFRNLPNRFFVCTDIDPSSAFNTLNTRYLAVGECFIFFSHFAYTTHYCFLYRRRNTNILKRFALRLSRIGMCNVVQKWCYIYLKVTSFQTQ